MVWRAAEEGSRAEDGARLSSGRGESVGAVLRDGR